MISLKLVDNHRLDIAIVTSALLLAAVVATFGVCYYVDRRAPATAPLIDRRIADMREAIVADPANVEARVAIAFYFLERKDFDLAIEQSEAVLQAIPTHEEAIFLAGKAYLAKGRDDKLVEYFERIVQLNRDAKYADLSWRLGIVHYDLGQVYLRRGQIPQAEQAFKSALQIDHADADAAFGLGQAFVAEGKTEQAIEAFRSAVRLDPTYTPFYEGLRDAYASRGMPDHAAYAAAMVRYGNGDYAGAVAGLLKVTAALPRFAEAFRALGMSYEQDGRPAEAIGAFQRALALDPGDRASQQGLGRLTRGKR